LVTQAQKTYQVKRRWKYDQNSL